MALRMLRRLAILLLMMVLTSFSFGLNVAKAAMFAGEMSAPAMMSDCDRQMAAQPDPGDRSSGNCSLDDGCRSVCAHSPAPFKALAQLALPIAASTLAARPAEQTMVSFWGSPPFRPPRPSTST